MPFAVVWVFRWIFSPPSPSSPPPPPTFRCKHYIYGFLLGTENAVGEWGMGPSLVHYLVYNLLTAIYRYIDDHLIIEQGGQRPSQF